MGLKQSYENWHNNPEHRHVHWGLLMVTALVVGNFLVGSINKTYLPQFTIQKIEAAGRSVITESDITYLGAKRMPFYTGLNSKAITGRNVNGVVRLFIYGPDGVYEVADDGTGDNPDYTRSGRFSLITRWPNIFKDLLRTWRDGALVYPMNYLGVH